MNKNWKIQIEACAGGTDQNLYMLNLTKLVSLVWIIGVWKNLYKNNTKKRYIKYM